MNQMGNLFRRRLSLHLTSILSKIWSSCMNSKGFHLLKRLRIYGLFSISFHTWETRLVRSLSLTTIGPQSLLHKAKQGLSSASITKARGFFTTKLIKSSTKRASIILWLTSMSKSNSTLKKTCLTKLLSTESILSLRISWIVSNCQKASKWSIARMDKPTKS